MNPYQEWLALDTDRPDYYQLLGIDQFESDRQRIASAADRAMSKVRSCRPGKHAALWAKLLDQLADAKRCLTDAQRREEYDQRLRAGQGQVEPLVAEPARPQAGTDRADFYPPGPAQPARGGVAEPEEEIAPPEEATPPVAFPSADAAPPNTFAAPDEAPDALPPTPLDVPYLAPAEPGAAQALDPMVPVTTGAPHGSLDPMAPVSPAQPPGTIAMPASDDLHPPSTDEPQIPLATRAVVPQSAEPAPGAQPLPMARPVATARSAAAAPAPPVAAPGSRTVLPAAESASQRAGQRGSGILLPILVGVTVGLLLLVVFGVSQYLGKSEPQGQAPGGERQIETAPAEPDEPNGPQTEPRPEPSGNNVNTPTTKGFEESLGGGFIAPPSERPPASGEPPGGAETTPDPPSPPVRRPAAPEPIPPQPAATPPTRAELVELGAALAAARGALTNNALDEAAAQLERARALAKLDQHQALVARLSKLAELVRDFHAAVDQAVASLEAGTQIRVSESTTVSVIEVDGDNLILDVAGARRAYPLDNLSPGLAMALATHALGDDHLQLPVLKGAYLAVHQRSGEVEWERVRNWWNQAALSYPEVDDLLPVLDDDYNLAGNE